MHKSAYQFLFQSTRPVWGATNAVRAAVHDVLISIHAPRVGRDSLLNVFKSFLNDFNPRAPCGARQAAFVLPDRPQNISIHAPRVGRDLVIAIADGLSVKFQSTRPVWGATLVATNAMWIVYISIHAPRVGRDHLSA